MKIQKTPAVVTVLERLENSMEGLCGSLGVMLTHKYQCKLQNFSRYVQTSKEN